MKRFLDNQSHICEIVLFITVVCHQQIGKECLGCRENVAVFNMSYFAKFYLTGPDAQKATDWIFTNNMAKPPGMYLIVNSNK